MEAHVVYIPYHKKTTKNRQPHYESRSRQLPNCLRCDSASSAVNTVQTKMEQSFTTSRLFNSVQNYCMSISKGTYLLSNVMSPIINQTSK